MKLRVNTLDQRRRAAAVWLSAGIGTLVLVALVLSLQLTALAAPGQTTWYVHPNGSDSDTGTLGLPFATIQYAIGVASDGDTILVAAGTYTENLVITETLTLRGGYTISGTAWLPSTGETIVDGSSSRTVEGDWDRGVYAPAVITDDGVFKMWYTGVDLYGISRVGYATSTNGIAWTRLVSPVLGPGNPGDWDETRVGQVSVLKNGPLYQMWFVGWDDGAVGQVGYATSTNGVDWTKYAGNPVLTVDAGAWDETEIGGPRVVFDGSTYHLWYHGFAGSCCDSIGYATSPDGINWSKHPSNPVFGPGPSGDWDDGVIYATDVLTDGGQLHMWYTGVRAGWVSRGIGYVTSTNGVTWTRFLTGPVLEAGDPGAWDENHVGWPAIVKTNALLHMWYRGSGSAGTALGYATSFDGVSWTKSAGNPVFSPGTPGQWGDPVVRFESGSDGAVLDGFTITGGDANEGSGVFVQGVSVVIANSIIAGNHAYHGGGGIMVDGNAQAQIVNVIVEHNDADYGGGIAVRSGSSALISGTRVISNTANESGGGVGIWDSGPVVVMVNTVISDNYGHHAGGLSMWEPGGAFTGTNLLIVDNRSGPGPAGIGLGGSGQLMNVTVSGNDSATGFDGAEIEGPASGFPIVNSIFWGNGTGNANLGGSNLNVSYSDIGGRWTGTGNIDADPQFVDAANGDYHLKPGSPCIDTGTPAGAPATDIEGAARDATPDMGAYEWSGFRIFLPLVLRNS